MDDTDARVIQASQLIECFVIAVTSNDDVLITNRQRRTDGLNEGIVQTYPIPDDGQSADQHVAHRPGLSA
jgi:hypothetical protein